MSERGTDDPTQPHAKEQERDTRVGLVCDPAKPTDIARRFERLSAEGGEDAADWDIEVVSEPFTVGCEDVSTALSRLTDRSRKQQWDLVVGVTELPLRDGAGRYLVTAHDPRHRAAILSLPALGTPRLHARSRQALGGLINGLTVGRPGDAGLPLPRYSGRSRLLLGMVLANRPWLLVPGLKTALVAALTTGAIATINSTVWVLASSLSWWRLAVATLASVGLVVGWLVVDGQLWDRPEDQSTGARDRSRLYNISTVLTLATGVITCYAALYLLNLAWALFVLDPRVMSTQLKQTVHFRDLFLLAWFVASAATVGGALGSGFESDEAIRVAAYSKREQERRKRLADQRT